MNPAEPSSPNPKKRRRLSKKVLNGASIETFLDQLSCSILVG